MGMFMSFLIFISLPTHCAVDIFLKEECNKLHINITQNIIICPATFWGQEAVHKPKLKFGPYGQRQVGKKIK